MSRRAASNSSRVESICPVCKPLTLAPATVTRETGHDGVGGCYSHVLGAFKRFRIAEAEIVLEGGGAGIEVGIAVRWHVARRCGPSWCRCRSAPAPIRP
jgi:hypothetical protein